MKREKYIRPISIVLVMEPTLVMAGSEEFGVNRTDGYTGEAGGKEAISHSVWDDDEE